VITFARGLLAAALAATVLSPAAPAGAEPERTGAQPTGAFPQASLTSAGDLRAAGYERMAGIQRAGATGTLWRQTTPAGGWNWHANIHHAPPGSEVRAENWYSNVVARALVPPGETGANTSSWGSRGRFRVCIVVAGGGSGCSYFSGPPIGKP
jgi:hypothetical protein